MAATLATRPWTLDEIEQAVRLNWSEFSEEYPDRTFDAYRLKRNRTKAQKRDQQERPLLGGGTSTVSVPVSEEEYETYFSLIEQATEQRRFNSPTQATSVFAAPDDGLPIAIAFTGDWHCGASGVLYSQLRQDLETIRDTPGLYAIGMGDLVEGVSTHSKAATALYSGAFNEPGLQDRYAIKRAGIAKGKWLAMMEGNHDHWSYAHAGITRTDKLAAHLECAFFPQGGGTVYVEVGDQRYVVAVRHNGKGNSQLNTSNAQRRQFDDWPLWDNCDVICLAHLHFNDLHIQTRKTGRCVYMRSGTYKIDDAYSRDKGFTSEYGVPLAIFLPDERKVIAFRGDDFSQGLEYFWLLRERYAVEQAA